MQKFKKILFVSLLLVISISYNITEAFAATTLDCTNTLKSGAKGEQVKVLQTELNKVMNCGLTVDGSFGPASKTCVLSFQKANSLMQDGIVGPLTCKKLNEVYLEAIADKDDAIASASDLICSSSNNLRAGSTGKQVKYLQEKLNKVMGCAISVDGSYGGATKTCVMDFQTKMGLIRDGVVGTETCNKIKEAYSNRTSAAFNKQGNEATLDCHNSLKKGKTGSNVKLLQTELNKVASCNLTVDGSFGNGTLNCVKQFQTTQKLTVDGSVGASTCGRLNTEYLKNNDYIISRSASPIRKAASSTSSQVAIATYGMVFKNYGSVGDWYKIKYNNEYAYIKKTNVKKDAILVDISNQNLKLYQNGKIKMDSLVITGLKNKNDTPQGTFTLNVSGKKTDINLVGADYSSPVDYWMPFIGSSYGFHDADAWRSNGQFYDKTRYTYNGSHGCVNMLDADAKMLYNKVTVNTTVYIVE